MIPRFAATLTTLFVLSIGLVRSAECDDLKSAIHKIRQVGPDGKGSAQAAEAWKVLKTAPIEQVPVLLAGMDGASPLAKNWIRAALDEMVDSAERAKDPLPTASLESFLADTGHDPQA